MYSSGEVVRKLIKNLLNNTIKGRASTKKIGVAAPIEDELSDCIIELIKPAMTNIPIYTIKGTMNPSGLESLNCPNLPKSFTLSLSLSKLLFIFKLLRSRRKYFLVFLPNFISERPRSLSILFRLRFLESLWSQFRSRVLNLFFIISVHFSICISLSRILWSFPVLFTILDWMSSERIILGSILSLV